MKVFESDGSLTDQAESFIRKAIRAGCLSNKFSGTSRGTIAVYNDGKRAVIEITENAYRCWTFRAFGNDYCQLAENVERISRLNYPPVNWTPAAGTFAKDGAIVAV